jgi:hypothetical protein
MTFSSQFEARNFLIEKITEQARQTETPLSEGERRMLELNLKVPDSAIGIPVEVLEDKSRAFEKKIVRLLKAAYNRDRDSAQKAQRYKDAVRTLGKSDHYILIVATAVIPVRNKLGRLLVYVIIALAMVGMIVVLQVWTRGK